jgi:type IX secretion system PorP/SprF family membrane protein
MYKVIKAFLFFFLMAQMGYSQEGIPVYSDYLSDNYYLIHPSMAGAANCAKVRLTARKQWFGQDDAPQLQTVSFNGRVSDKAGAGIIVFNDKNGYHSQKGLKVSYAYHLLFSRDEIDLNQLSFGLSAGVIQSQLDETEFLNSGDFDPNINGNIVQRDSYLNFDFGASYNYLNFYAHGTIKNVVETRRQIYSVYESDNLRKYLLSAGYVFGNKERVLWEPSLLFQLTEKDFGSLWGGVSYRRTLDGAEYVKNNSVATQKLQFFSPIVGLNYNNFMIAYTYSQVAGAVRFDNGGYHQITLGLNLFCKREKYECNCPAIN